MRCRNGVQAWACWGWSGVLAATGLCASVHEALAQPTCDSLNFNNTGGNGDVNDYRDYLVSWSFNFQCPGCNDLDFNNDGVVNNFDAEAFASRFAGGPCVGAGNSGIGTGPSCQGPDFNNDGIFPDVTDLEAWIESYFVDGCAPSNAVCNSADFNLDGLTNVYDLMALREIINEGSVCLGGALPTEPCGTRVTALVLAQRPSAAVTSVVRWFPTGPASPVYVVAGPFSAGFASYAAAFHPSSNTLSSLPVPASWGLVSSAVVLQSGDLALFNSAIGAVSVVPRQGNQAWSATPIVPPFPPATYNAVAVTATGTRYIAGRFGTITDVAANSIARWTGSAWAPLGTGLRQGNDPGWVSSMLLLPNGDVFVTGGFDRAGPFTAANAAAWDGTTWTPLGTGLFGSSTRQSVLDAQGRIVVDDANRVRRWNGTAWEFLPALPVPPSSGKPANAIFRRLQTDVSGNVQVVYESSVEFVFQRGSRVATLVDDVWQVVELPGPERLGQFGDVQPVLGAVQMDNGAWLMGGRFRFLGGVRSDNLAVVRVGCPTPGCDSIDFNNDTSFFDPQDINAFLSVYSEGPCVPATATCNDIDFNNDTSVFDPCDINSFLVQYSEGPCTPCGQ